MDSLFVGPYKENNINGFWSTTIASNIIDNKPENAKLVCRNIYTNNAPITNPIVADKIQKYETADNYSNIKQLIQHVPDRCIYLSQYLESNICIPILSKKNISEEAIYRLSLCNMVLVDNIFHFEYLNNLLTNVSMIDFDIDDVATGKASINLGVYKNTRKMYFIGEYSQNKDLILDLVLTFIVVSQIYDNISLILFLHNTSKQDNEDLQSTIHKIYRQLNITNVFSKVVCVPIDNNKKTLLDCHNACDIYLDINDTAASSINSKYAALFGNQVIDSSELVFDSRIIRNNIIDDKLYHAPTQTSLVDAIRRGIQSPQTTKKFDTPILKLAQIIWK